MRTSDRYIQTNYGLLEEQPDSVPRVSSGPQRVVWRLLLSILGSGLIIAGPVTLRTIAHASLIAMQILLELGRLCLAAFQVLGT